MLPKLPSYPYQIAAYFTEWGAGKGYYVKSIEDAGSAEKITLINYAFGIPEQDPKTGEVVCQIDDPNAAYGQIYGANISIDGAADDPNQPLRGHFNQLKKLKAKYPHIKVVVSVGGWTGSVWFSDAAKTAESRQKFVASCIDQYILGNLAEQNGAGGRGAAAGVFDGIDIDWEYPVDGGAPGMHHAAEDGENFALLLQEFRKQYQALGREDLLLTMAAPAPGGIAVHFKLSEAHQYLDLVNIMTYDMRGAWSGMTGHHTNPCTANDDYYPEGQRLSVDNAVRLFRDEYGIPTNKILVGGAFYGKAWANVGSENNGLYQPGEAGPEGGSNYRDLKEKIGKGFTRFWDAKAKAPWLYSPAEKLFYSYDDPESVAIKAQYVRANHLGGVMFWEISGDDAQGGLVNAIDAELRRSGTAANPCK